MRHAPLHRRTGLRITHCARLLAGLAFLSLFVAWGIVYIRSHTRPAAVRVGGTIWGALAGGAAALLLGQIILQTIYAAGNADWATDPHTRRLLQLFGLTKASNARQTILVMRASTCNLECLNLIHAQFAKYTTWPSY